MTRRFTRHGSLVDRFPDGDEARRSGWTWPWGGWWTAGGGAESFDRCTRERARFVHNMIHTVPASETEERVRGLNCVPRIFLRRCTRREPCLWLPFDAASWLEPRGIAASLQLSCHWCSSMASSIIVPKYLVLRRLIPINHELLSPMSAHASV